MINKIMTLNKTSLRLTCDEITARASRDYGSCFTRFLRPLDGVWRCNRLAVTLLLMMVVGVNNTWGAFTEGLYYIKSNSNTAFYLCPSIGCYYSNNIDQPHLTTFKTGDDQYPIWKIVPVENETDTYYLIHYKTGRYLKSNEDFTTDNGSKHNRKAVHLEVKPETFTDEFKFLIKNSSSPYQIYPKSYYTDASGMSFNPTSGHKECYAPADGVVQGIIGLYSKDDGASKWQITTVATASTPCATPIIKYDGGNITISYPYSDETGVTIYYTTDGTDPSTSGTKLSYSSPISTSGVIKVRAIATKTDLVNSDEAVLWGSARPFLIQSKECADYYLAPSGNNINVCTTSIPGTSMQWTLQDAGSSTGGVQYYYVENSNSKRINYKSSDNAITFNEVSDDAKKFCVIENGYNTGNFFLIPVSQTSRVIYKVNGNVASDHCNAGVNKNWNTNLDQWIFRVCNASADQKDLFSGAPFNVSDNNETHYYHIANVGADGYYIVPPTDTDGYATTSNTSADYTNNPWIFKVATTDSWQTYYYIINAASGKYMYFNPNNNLTENQENVISLKDVSEKNAENEEKFQFIMVRSTTTGACYIVSKGYSYADTSHKNFNGNTYFGLWFDDKNPAALKTIWSRSSTANHVKWSFEETTITDLYLAPVFSQDENGYVLITHPTAACDYYYTTDGSTPTVPASAETAPTAPTYKYTGPFRPEIGITQIKAQAVVKNDYTVSSSVVTYDLPEYAQPTITYDYENSTITISTDEGARVYYSYGNAPSDPTIDPSVTTQTFTTDAITSTTVVKALAVKEGWAPSAIVTMTVYKPTIELSASMVTYNNTDLSPTITVKDGDDDIDAGKYNVSYQKDGEVESECKDAGTYTVIVSDVEGDNEIVCGTTTFTINPAALTITPNDDQIKEYGDPDPVLTYANVGLMEGDELTGALARAEGESVGNYEITQGTLDNSHNPNYTITFTTGKTFAIGPKSLGNGNNPDENFTIEITEANPEHVVVKQGGESLRAGTDYSITTTGDADTKYYKVTITGANNYAGSFKATFVNLKLSKRFGSPDPGGAATFVSDANDGNFVVPDNMTAYIVTGINNSAGTVEVEQLDNIPEGVPVLLLSTVNTNGFIVKAKDDGTAPQGTNLLKVDAADKDVSTGEIYVLYKGEFVLNAEGTLPAGKIYLEKTGGSQAPARLTIDWSVANGIEEISFSEPDMQRPDTWYTLEGIKLNGSPAKRGLYLKNGKKTIVK